MKVIILVATLLCSIQLMGATAERSIIVDEKDYVIRYEFGGTFGFAIIPSTMPPGRPHHQGALVTVYERQGKNLLFLRESRGVYVEDEPCFEDDPEKTVRFTLKQLAEKKAAK